MADPKYANLPGIDTDSPDVYETSDLPEDDQAQAKLDELESESVEHLKLDPNQAYSRFKGKGIDAKRTDFSDQVKGPQHTGYDATEYEILGEGSKEKETLQQRYQRLQHEMRELVEDLNKAKSSAKDDSASSPVELSKQVEYLQHQLTDLHLEKIIGAEASLDLADPQGAIQRRLVEQLDSFKQAKAAGKSPAKAQPVGGDKVTYELYYRAEQAKFSQSAKLADLEQRLERMEAVIGQTPEKLSSLTAGVANKSLVSAVSALAARTSLLDPEHISSVEGRLQVVNSKLNQIQEKKTALEEDKQTKVHELYDMVKKWEDMAVTLPHVVDRLTSLKDLHEQALQFSAALSHLDTAQQQISTNLADHTNMLKKLQASFEDNMKTIKSNCDSIDQRLKSVKK